MNPLRVFYIFLIIIAIATYIYGEAMGYFRSHHYYECERISEKNLFYVNTKEQYLIHITNDKNKKFLDVIKTNLLKKLTKRQIVLLGGVNLKTLKRSKLCSPNGVAAISWIKKNGPSINTGPF